MSNNRECILNCPKIRGTPLHAFPKDEVRRQVWLRLINMEYTSKVNTYLCGRHFSPRMIGKRNLRNDAVPDIHLEYVEQPGLCSEDGEIIEYDEGIFTNIKDQSDTTEVALMFNNVKNLHCDPLFVPSDNFKPQQEKTVDECTLLRNRETKAASIADAGGLPVSEAANVHSVLKIDPKVLSDKKRSKKNGKFCGMRTPLAPLEMKLATRIWQRTEFASENSNKLPTLKPQCTNQTVPMKMVNHALNKKQIPSTQKNYEKTAEKLVISPEGPVRVKNIHDIDGTWKEQARKVAQEIKNAKSLLFEAHESVEESVEDSSAIIIEDHYETHDEHITIIDDTLSQQTPNNFIPTRDSSNVRNIELNATRCERTINDLLCNEILSSNDLLCDEELPSDDKNDDDRNLSKYKGARDQNSVQLINEELFDGTSQALPQSSSNILMMGVEDFKKHADDSGDSDNAYFISQAAQTGLNLKHSCGLIQKHFYNGTFHLSCFYCAIEFPIEDWNKFINHISNDHQRQMKPKGYNISHEDIIRLSKLQTMKSFPHYSSTDSNNLLSNCNNQLEGGIPKTLAIMPLHQTISDEKTVSQKMLHPVETLQNGKSSHNKDSMEESILNIDDFNKNEHIINLMKTDPGRVLRFLEVLREHPLLWHTRRHGPTVYDKETEEFTRKFDATMLPIDFRRSMDHIRHWHRRHTPLTANIMTLLNENTHHKDYLEILYEIEELSTHYAFYCDQCEYYFLDCDRLATHKYLKHNVGDLKFPCSCGLRFETMKKKDEHELSHKPKPSFMCELCGMTFIAKSSLQSHLNTKHAEVIKDPLPYKCTKCDAKFPNLHMRSWHVLKHAPPRFNCKICGRNYYKIFQFKHHMKKHMNQRDFVCEDCGKGFVEKRALLNHRYRMHDIGGYYCEYCNTYYSTYEKLDMHNKTIHPNGTNTERRYITRYRDMRKRNNSLCFNLKPRIFKCKECGSLFERQYQLMRHKRKLGHNLGESIFKCSHCSSVFKSRVGIIRHLRVKHDLKTKRGHFKEENYLVSTPDNNSYNCAQSNGLKNECEYAVQTIICSEEGTNIVQPEEIQDIFEEFDDLKLARELSHDHLS